MKTVSSSLIIILFLFAIVATSSSTATASNIDNNSKKKKNQKIRGVRGGLKEEDSRRRILKGDKDNTDVDTTLPTSNCKDITSTISAGVVLQTNLLVEDHECIILENVVVSGSITIGQGGRLLLYSGATVKGDVIVDGSSTYIYAVNDSTIEGMLSVLPHSKVHELNIDGPVLGGITIEDTYFTGFIYISNSDNAPNGGAIVGGAIYMKNVEIEGYINLDTWQQTDSIYLENINFINVDNFSIRAGHTMRDADVTLKSITGVQNFSLEVKAFKENNVNVYVDNVVATNDAYFYLYDGCSGEVGLVCGKPSADVYVSNLEVGNDAFFQGTRTGHLHIKDSHAPKIFSVTVSNAESITFDNVLAEGVVSISSTTVKDGDVKIKNCHYSNDSIDVTKVAYGFISILLENLEIDNGNLVVEKVTTSADMTEQVDITVIDNTVKGESKDIKLKDNDITGKMSIYRNNIFGNGGYLIVDGNTIGMNFAMENNPINGSGGGLVWIDNTAGSYTL